MSLRVSLDETDFQTIVEGGIVTKMVRKTLFGKKRETVQIILSDIGFDRMYACVDNAVEKMYSHD